MKEIKLLDWFDKVNYDWKDDYNNIGIICYYTKTRNKPHMVCELEDFQCGYGSEQPFFIKSVVDWIAAENFFEIGTGRGTASHAASLNPSVKRVFTMDIRPYTQKYNYAIGYKQSYVSNEDLYNMIPGEHKSKIEYKDISEISDSYNTKFDVCFIDGNHSDYNIIMEDFEKCLRVIKDDGIIVWDDYDPNKFAVKSVVDDILKKQPEYNAILVPFRGHLFGNANKEMGAGEVIMSRRKLF